MADNENKTLTTATPPTGERIVGIDMESEMKKSFVAYAMAVIINRALPDVRDGLKPVHRRILYSMDELGLSPDKPYRKSARIVGDCLGKYHPHGDSSVYDAMVRLAQDFSTRYQLVQGHGNFGSVDGDGAAAMRYTEAKLSKLSMEMLRDIDKQTVDFYPNFDETLMQPSVLPSRFPNLLVNGSGGIAVGMATNIPPHNLREAIDACVAMIDDPEIDTERLMDIVQGPDFPTGGIIMGKAGIRESYRTGRGKIVVRSRCEIEPMPNNKSQIIVTEIPYQVNKAKLVEKIAELVHEHRVEGISDLRDESGRDGMRIVIEIKRDVNANVVLNQLYKHTQLQDTFGVINLALVDNEPKVLSLKQMLKHYIEHQYDVIVRRTRFELDKAAARAHILQGLIIALDNIDEVVSIIRGSSNAAEAKQRLMEKDWGVTIDRLIERTDAEETSAATGLSDKQAQAILDMRFQRLTGLERDKITAEFEDLLKDISYYRAVLNDDHMVYGIIKSEMLEIRDKYGDDRRTSIEPVFDELETEDLIDEEDVVVTLTHFGYIKRVPKTTYRAQKRGGRGVSAGTVREEDFVEDLFVTSTHTAIMCFTNKGRVFTVKCYTIPEAGRTAKGTPIVNLLQLDDGEKVTACLPVEGTDMSYLVMCTRLGVIKKTPTSEFDNIRKTGLKAIVLREDDELISVLASTGRDDIIVATHNGKCIRFDEGDVRGMGRSAAGVRAITLEGDDYVVSMEKITDEAQVLSISEQGLGKRSEAAEYRRQLRGGKGIIAAVVNERTGPLASLHIVEGGEDVMIIRDDGTIIRTSVESIRQVSRNSLGVKLMQVGEGLKIVSATVVQPEPIDPDESDEPTDSNESEEAENAENMAEVQADQPQTDELSQSGGAENDSPDSTEDI